MEQLTGMLAAKRDLFQRYSVALANVAGAKLVAEPAQCRSNYWLQTLLLDAAQADQRDAILAATNEEGLMTRPAWILMHELSPFADCPRMDLKGARSLAQRLINIPSSSRLVQAAS
jgi:dTDP-4-amino-4,6-dideoxygalactose transaminase